MHILVIPSWYPTIDWPFSGIFFREQAHALKQAGYKAGVVVPVQWSLRQLPKLVLHRPQGFSTEDDAGIPTYRCEGWAWLPRVPYGNMTLWLRSGRWLFERYLAAHGRPDVIHAHSMMFAGVLGEELQRQHHIPLVVTEHSSKFMRGLISPWQVPIIRRVIKQAQARLAVSSQLCQLLAYQYDGKNYPWVCVPNMVDTTFFSPNHGPSPHNASDQQTFIFFSVAILFAIKGYTYLIDAFAKQFRGKNVYLWIGGDGEERSRLEAQVDEVGVQKQIIFLGAMTREQVREAIWRCHAFVLPSLYETFGTVLIEAIACGKPVIATRCGGPESIVNEVNGILVPPADPTALGYGMQHIVSNISNFDPNQIRTDCASRFSKDMVVQRLGKIYDEVVRSFHSAYG